jgi:hypothetical protein
MNKEKIKYSDCEAVKKMGEEQQKEIKKWEDEVKYLFN